MGKRCQVCDGPIVNGRCKYCGMPYRNDMELYHLNEDRSEHYRHASAKVRKAMKESEVPLPDRNKTVKKPGKTNNSRTQMPKAQTARVQTTGTKQQQDVLLIHRQCGLTAQVRLQFRIRKRRKVRKDLLFSGSLLWF